MQVLNSRSLSVELEFRIPIFSGIPYSQSCILDCKAQDTGLNKQKCLGYPDSKSKKGDLLDETPPSHATNLNAFVLNPYVRFLSNRGTERIQSIC